MRLDATLLVVAPHPDDEVLGCGWLMRRVTCAGGRVVVAWMTDGGASHGDLAPAARSALVARRREEALAGLAALGIAPAATHFLGYPDGDLAGHAAAAGAALAAIVHDHGVATIVVTSDADGHPDHRASFAIAAGLTGVERYAYSVSARYDGDPVADPVEAVRIDDRSAAAAKRAALACHASQTAAGGARYPLSAAAIERFCVAPETFVAIGHAT